MRRLVDRLRETLAARHIVNGADLVKGVETLDHHPHPERPDLALEASRLHEELLRLYQEGTLEPASDVALQILEIRHEQFGDRHPEYAIALDHYALLLQGLGNLEDAESGLREVLDIRHETLGDQNPLVAMTMSQLGMVLVENGKWDDAEVVLQEAVAMRRHLFGENHPNVVADLKMLDMLRHRRGEAAIRSQTSSMSVSAVPVKPKPQHTSTPHHAVTPRAAEIGRVESGEMQRSDAALQNSMNKRDAASISADMKTLAGSLTRIGAGMSASGHRMVTQGITPDPRLLFDATSCQRQFASLCDEANRRAEALDLDLSRFMSHGQDRFSLPDLTVVFEEIFRLESDSAKHYIAKKTALALVSRVLDLTHTDPKKSPSLRPVLEFAESVRSRLKQSPPTRSSDDALAILDGTHPLVALDRLTRQDEELDDETWTRLYETLATSQGKKLAASAARKRLKPRQPAAAASPLAMPDQDPNSGATLADLMDSALDDEDFLPTRVTRGNVIQRIVIPDTAALIPKPKHGHAYQPTHGPAPRHATPIAPAPSPIAAKARNSQPLTPHDPKGSKPLRNGNNDSQEFLRTQTSFITQ